MSELRKAKRQFDLKGGLISTYARVSSDKQKDNTSIPGQIAYHKEALASIGYSVAYSFQDTSSGKDADRPGLEKAYQQIKKYNQRRKEENKVKWFLVYHWNRWFRNRDLSSLWRIRFKEIGVEVNCLRKWIDYQDAGSIVLHSVEEGLAHATHLEIRSHAIKSHYDLAKSGRVSGKLPRWLTKTEEGYSLVPKYSEPLSLAFQYIANGGNAKAIYRKLGGAAVFGGKSTYYVTLKNTLCAGRIVKKSTIEGLPDIDRQSVYPAVTTWEIFSRAQKVLCKGPRVKSKETDLEFFAKGAFHCPVCAGSMTSEVITKPSGKVFKYYRCSPDVKHARIRKEEVDKLLKKALASMALNSAAYDYLQKNLKAKAKKAKGEIGQKVGVVKRQLEKQEGTIKRARQMYIAGELDKADFEAVKLEKGSLENELVKLEFMKANQGQVYQLALGFLKNLGKLLATEDKAILKEALKVIFPDGFTFEPHEKHYILTPRLNTMFYITGLSSKGYTGIKIKTGDESAPSPVKGGRQDCYLTSPGSYASDFQLLRVFCEQKRLLTA